MGWTILLTNVPAFVDDVIARTAARGAVDISMLKVGAYIQFISGPLIGGLMGAVISFAGGYVGKKID